MPPASDSGGGGPAELAPELREVLACPRCKGGLEFREELGEIRCLLCRLAFRIEGGIPVMLLDEARPLDG